MTDTDADVDARLFRRLHGRWPDGYEPPAVNGHEPPNPWEEPGYAETVLRDPTATMRSRLLDLSALAALPPPVPLVTGVLDLDSTSVIYGRRGSFKSFVALDLALAVAAGFPWHGHAVAQGTVLYVVAEGVSGLNQRVEVWRGTYRTADPAARLLVLPETVNLLSPSAVGEFADTASSIGATFVIIDTLARCMPGGDENSAKDVGIAVAHLDVLRRRTGAHVAAVHHSGKDSRAGARGSSALEAAADTVIECVSSDLWLADADDDDYDLSWFNDLPEGDRSAITRLRELLLSDPDPIDRHFQFAELEGRLYRCRDLYETALDEYDEACRRHDAEMERMCEVFKAKWGKVPLLDTYRQMAIRQQKAKDWAAVVWWTERGLALYADDAAREESVEDLMKRRNRAKAKSEPPLPRRPQPPKSSFVAPVGQQPAGLAPPVPAIAAGEMEVLVCESCGQSFERMKVRGRKPKMCPECRSSG